VAAAEAYNRLMTAVWRFLLGIEPRHLGGVGSKKSCASRTAGLFGEATGAVGANEEQGRTALHQHIVFWGGLHPEVLQANLEQFMEPTLRGLLESMFKAEVRVDVHIADIIRREQRIPASRPGYMPHLKPGDPGFSLRAEMIAVQTNVHTHAPTCKCAPPPPPPPPRALSLCRSPPRSLKGTAFYF